MSVIFPPYAQKTFSFKETPGHEQLEDHCLLHVFRFLIPDEARTTRLPLVSKKFYELTWERVKELDKIRFLPDWVPENRPKTFRWAQGTVLGRLRNAPKAQVQELDLSMIPNLDDKILESLKEFSSLKKLKLGFKRSDTTIFKRAFTEEKLIDFVQSSQSLTSLDLDQCDGVTPELLNALQAHPNLTRLTLFGKKEESEENDTIHQMVWLYGGHEFSKLEKLMIHFGYFNGFNINPLLTHLALRDVVFEKGEDFLKLIEFKQLRFLFLSSLDIRDGDPITLPFEEMEFLEALSLDSEVCSPEHLNEFLPRLSNLEFLSLQCHSVPRDFEEILRQLRGLREVHIDFSGASPQDIIRVARGIENSETNAKIFFCHSDVLESGVPSVLEGQLNGDLIYHYNDETKSEFPQI